jgi:SAM-dependent methyltransferase
MRERSAGDFDYETGGVRYAVTRRPDPRIAAHVHAALGPARSVINVGAGAGSYEPTDRDVTAVEPAATMRAQRPPHLATAIDATAQALPFADNSFDAAMASFTIHQWPDLDAGLRELRRVSRGPVVILTADGEALKDMWLVDYAPDLLAVEARRMPAIDHVRDVLGGTSTVEDIPIPIDCADGFAEAYYARPEAFLRSEVRQSQSAWAFVDPEYTDNAVAQLRADLESGVWDRRYGALRTQPELSGALRLITALP